MLIDDLRKQITESVRHFADFPGLIFFDDFYDHIKDLIGSEINVFEADGTLEMWLEFTYRENKFFVDNKFGEYALYVEDNKCPDDILLEIAAHLRQLLENNEAPVQELGESEM